MVGCTGSGCCCGGLLSGIAGIFAGVIRGGGIPGNTGNGGNEDANELEEGAEASALAGACIAGAALTGNVGIGGVIAGGVIAGAVIAGGDIAGGNIAGGVITGGAGDPPLLKPTP